MDEEFSFRHVGLSSTSLKFVFEEGEYRFSSTEIRMSRRETVFQGEKKFVSLQVEFRTGIGTAHLLQ